VQANTCLTQVAKWTGTEELARCPQPLRPRKFEDNMLYNTFLLKASTFMSDHRLQFGYLATNGLTPPT